MRGRSAPGLPAAAFAALLLAATFVPARAADPPLDVPGERELITLKNGVQVLLCRDTLASAVDVAVWYDAGVRREPAGKSGLAALCQRLMFTGSAKVPAGEHLRRIEAAGGDAGALVAGDYACYFQTVPEPALGLAIELEASRMGGIAIDARRLDLARQALRYERRQPAAAAPVAIGVASLYRSAFRDHPYGHPVLGDERELSKLTLKDVQDWYRAHYGPRHALVTIVGRFDPAAARTLARQHFEPVRAIPGADAAEPAAEPEPTGERRARETVNVPFRVALLGFRGPGAGDREVAALVVLSQILSGPDGRLERDLKRRLPSVFLSTGDFEVRRDASLLFCAVGIDSPADSARAEAELVAEIERLGREPVSAAEILRARRQAETRLLFDWQPSRGRALALAAHQLMNGDASASVADIERIRAITPADVQAAAEKWLSGRRRNVVWLAPAAEAAAPGSGGGR